MARQKKAEAKTEPKSTSTDEAPKTGQMPEEAPKTGERDTETAAREPSAVVKEDANVFTEPKASKKGVFTAVPGRAGSVHVGRRAEVGTPPLRVKDIEINELIEFLKGLK